MIIFPAIDVRGGRVVRLKEGDPGQQTVFADDPIETAQRWLDDGAAWLHMVNLDGSFGEANDSLRILERIAKLTSHVQFGGGIRDFSAARRALEAGAARVILGTVLVKTPEIVGEITSAYGSESVCVGLDARDGMVVTHGWQQQSGTTPVELGKKLARLGAKYALFTDVNRDGLLSGVNVEGTEALASETGLRVIASGGISSLEDVRRLAEGGIVEGAVIGMALYMGAFGLREALDAAKMN